jgi:hypothetical protein
MTVMSNAVVTVPALSVMSYLPAKPDEANPVDVDSQPQDGYVYDFLNSGNLITKLTVDASSTP